MWPTFQILNSNSQNRHNNYIRVYQMKKIARTFVIQEDEHLENLRKIIKRDYFGTASAAEEKETISMTLNNYLSNYKSNENQLFSEMVETDKQEWKKNHWWFDKQDKMLMIANSEKFEALPYHNMLQNNRNVNGIDTSLTKQDAKNSFFFNREKNFGSLQSQEYEQSKKVVYSNCKFDDPVNRMKEYLLVKREQTKPYREQGKEWEAKDKGKQRKQSVSATPLPQDDGHLMTWGQIESTPMRIAGPEFRIPETPQREIILSNLNAKINKEKLQPPKKSEMVMKILGSLTPSLNSRLVSKNRFNSSIRRDDSVNRSSALKAEKSEISGLLNIKK